MFFYVFKMALEKSRIKFAKSRETGEIIGFVSSHPRTKKLKGVREDSRFGKKICVLASDLKGSIDINVLYDVELKKMNGKNGYVVVSATPVLQKVKIETVTNPKGVYQVVLHFGYKTIYFDPCEGKTNSSKTIQGVIDELRKRNDIADIDNVIEQFKVKAENIINIMQKDKEIKKIEFKNETN